MTIKARRANMKVGPHSRGMIIPAQLEIGKTSTIVADRLLLADIRGEISENDLLEFYEEHIEPRFWEWYNKKRRFRCIKCLTK